MKKSVGLANVRRAGQLRLDASAYACSRKLQPAWAGRLATCRLEV